MIFVVACLFDVERGIVFGDIEQFPFHVREEAVVEDVPAVFGRKDDVVIAEPDAVMAFPIATLHAPILPSQGNEARVRASIPALTRGVLMRE